MRNRVAIVTGASSGIGLEISKVLLGRNFNVYAISRDFSKLDINNPCFIKVSCDLNDIKDTVNKINFIKEKNPEVDILVNNAGVGFFAPHEELNPQKIEEMCNVNLVSPLIITSILLRSIKRAKGFIINISSITAKRESPMGCAYSATKAGLYHFGRGLFEETRKYGVKVINICPDITKTNFFKRLNFCESEEPESYLTPQCIAKTIEMLLDTRKGSVITEIEIRPQIHRIRKK